MRLSPSLASTALLLLCGLASVLLSSPTANSAQGAERTVFDATIQVIPPVAQAPCMQLEDGILTARAVLTGDAQPQPAVLKLSGYQNFEAVVGAELVLSRDETSTSLPLKGGLWCWSIEVSPPIDLQQADVAQRSAYVQYVAVKLTLVPA